MNSNCAFRIGAAHSVCQDYAVARGGIPAYAILADGCSSSPDTDIGARLLVKSAEAVIGTLARDFAQGTEAALVRYYAAALARACRLARSLRLEREGLDATLLTLIASPSHWLAAVYGDGVLAARHTDGVTDVTAITYAENCPRYLNYQGDRERIRAFEARRETGRKIERLRIAPDGTLCERSIHEDDGRALYSEIGACAEYAWIAAISDGVTSFTSRAGVLDESERLTLPAVLSTLLDFKSTTGLFVQRRLRKFAQEMERCGRRHHDDLALAAVALQAEA